MIKRNSYFLVAALSAAIVSGCSKPSDTASTDSTTTTTTGSSSGASSKKLNIAFVTNNASDYWTLAHKGVDKAAKELGANVNVDFEEPGKGTVDDQTRIMNDLLAKGVDGMAMSPVQPADETDLINKAAKASLLFTMDSDAPASDRACYVGSDNTAAGKMAGEELKKALPNGGKVMVFVGKADAQNAKDRIDGLKAAIAGTKIEVIDVRTDDTDHVKAKQNAADTITKYPDIAGLVGIWSYNGPAIVNAVKDAKKQGAIKIVCFDEEDDTLTGVADGSIFATVVQQPFEFGYQSIKMLAAALNGDKSKIPADKRVIIPTLAIEKDSVADFKKKTDELRGRTK